MTTGEVKGVLYPELLFWANLMCLPQSLLWLPPCRIVPTLELEGFWLAKIKHELLRLSCAVDGPNHISRVCVCVCVCHHHLVAYHSIQGQWKLIRNLWLGATFGCSPPSWLFLVINVCTDITSYFKGLLTQPRVHFYHTAFNNESCRSHNDSHITPHLWL